MRNTVYRNGTHKASRKIRRAQVWCYCVLDWRTHKHQRDITAWPETALTVSDPQRLIPSSETTVDNSSLGRHSSVYFYDIERRTVKRHGETVLSIINCFSARHTRSFSRRRCTPTLLLAYGRDEDLRFSVSFTEPYYHVGRRGVCFFFSLHTTSYEVSLSQTDTSLRLLTADKSRGGVDRRNETSKCSAVGNVRGARFSGETTKTNSRCNHTSCSVFLSSLFGNVFKTFWRNTKEIDSLKVSPCSIFWNSSVFNFY